MKKIIFAIACASIITNGIYAKPRTHKEAVQGPQLFIKTVKNDTPFNILMVDRLASDPKTNSITIIAGQKVAVNFQANRQHAVSIRGSMSETMARYAQYTFIKLDTDGKPMANQEVYLNLNTAPGGVDNGSGIISGIRGTRVLNFYVAGQNGGCSMETGPFKNSVCKQVEFDLRLSISEKDIAANIFRMYIDSERTEK
ncbi:hypothetical protein H0X48_02810 [Candidatus Dependentiae bacterium]|nr:hypothetical protein [Candidatus Dependentiae bacterium]